jgi:hypothetical protein
MDVVQRRVEEQLGPLLAPWQVLVAKGAAG